MPWPECKKGKKKGSHEEHTPIVSKTQQKFFGAELGRAKKGESRKTKMSPKMLLLHLREVRGKKLPKKIKGK